MINAKGPMQNVAPSRKPRLTCPGHVRIQNILAGRLLFPVLFVCILPACRSTNRGGMNNLYDGSNAWTDTNGALHLCIQKKEGKWSCAEVVMTRSLGYGTYNVVVGDISQLEPAVFSTTTFDDWGGDQHYREMDMEISKWGDAERKNNAQYGIQPFFVPGNMAPFAAPSGTFTHSLHWESGRASFKTVRGSSIKLGLNSEPPLFSSTSSRRGYPRLARRLFNSCFTWLPTRKAR